MASVAATTKAVSGQASPIDESNVPAQILRRLRDRDPLAPSFSLEQSCERAGIDHAAIADRVAQRLRDRKRAKAPRAT